jgi:carbon storage regulator
LLVLGRKKNESLVIGDNIVITILGVEGDQVKIGIQAPREITIVREELLRAVQEQSQKAADLQLLKMQDQFQALKSLLIENIPQNNE